MKGKTKLFLINCVFFALFLTLFFDKNEAFNEDNLVEKIQNNLIYAAFPAEPRARYVFNREEGFKGWRIYQLKNIAELDQDDDKTPRGSTQSNDVLQIEEYLNIDKLNEYRPMTDEESVKYPPLGSRQVKHMKNVFKKAVKSLRRKVDFFSGKNFNHFVCNAEQVRGALEKFENDGNLNVDLDTLSFVDSFSPERGYQMLRGRSRHFPNICQCFTPSNFERGETSQQSFEPGNESDCKKLIQLVLDCKIFIKNLHYRGKEGTLIDILSFMKVEELTSLKLIYDLSDIQSKKLDEAINSRIYKEHLRNEQNNGNKHAIVQGAGPVGLYAAYKLFNDGLNVTLVNDRSEEYLRNRVVDFDRIWMYELRYFLGTKFDEFFKRDGSFGKIFDEDIGFFNIKNLENLLKERLKELSAYIDSRKGNNGNSFLKLIYETAVLDIDESQIKPIAILGTPEKQFNPNASKEYNYFMNNWLNEHRMDPETARYYVLHNYIENIKKIYGENLIPYTRYRGDKAVEYLTAEQYAVLQIQGKAFKLKDYKEEFSYLNEKVIDFKNYKNVVEIPFDYFFCAGGVSDQMRNKYLGRAVPLTESKNYGVVIFDKKYWNRDAYAFDDGVAFYRDPIAGMRTYLTEQGIDELIRDSNVLSEELKHRYSNLTGLILNGKTLDENGNQVKGSPSVVVRLFESNPTLHIASITPLAIAGFINQVNKEKRNKANELKEGEEQMYNSFMESINRNQWVNWEELTNLKNQNEEILKKYDDFHDEFQKKWATALFNYTFNTRHREKIGTVVIRERDENGGGNRGEASTSKSHKGKEKVQEGQQILYYDRYSFNTATFDVAIYGINNPVRTIRADGGDEAIIAAIGDANTSAHFMTASGISTGRIGVESASTAIKNNLEGTMGAELRKVRRRVLEKAHEYVKVVEPYKTQLGLL